jgi:hypothetical protein
MGPWHMGADLVRCHGAGCTLKFAAEYLQINSYQYSLVAYILQARGARNLDIKGKDNFYCFFFKTHMDDFF